MEKRHHKLIKKNKKKIDKCVFVTCVTVIVNLTKKKRLFMMILTKLLWKLLCLVCFSQISIYALTPFWFSFNEALLDPENRTRNIPPIHIYNAFHALLHIKWMWPEFVAVVSWPYAFSVLFGKVPLSYRPADQLQTV